MADDNTSELAALLNEPYREYWAGLGQFIHEFSAVEAVLGQLAAHVAELKEPISRAVLHGVRVDNGKDLINRVLEAKCDLARKERLADAFAQLGEIGAMRNHMVHWGAREIDGELRVSNRNLAHTPERVRTYTVSAKILADMRADLLRIYLLLTIEMYAEVTPPIMAPAYVRRVRGGSWRYKPQPQSPQRKTRDSREPHPKQQRQRASSRPKSQKK